MTRRQSSARALAEGFVYQGETIRRMSGKPRGHRSTHLPPAAFVDFLQNHDQTGNRALGERLISLAGRERVRALTAMLLLSPHIPLLFMGEEYGERRPFLFFTDFQGDLADAVREGRRKEFAGFAGFEGGHVPDPNARETFLASKLDWDFAASEEGREWSGFVRGLLQLRADRIVPLIKRIGGHAGRMLEAEQGIVAVAWKADVATLQMVANLSDAPRKAPQIEGEILYSSADGGDGVLPPDAVVVAVVEEGSGAR